MTRDSLLGETAMSRGLGIALKDEPGVPEPANEGGAHSDKMKARVARLTAGQLDCLRLVDQHLSSKEIATELGISPHTVDQRIRQALQTLGVERRSQAARVVAQYAGEYQRLIHQSPHIETSSESDHPSGAVGILIRHA